MNKLFRSSVLLLLLVMAVMFMGVTVQANSEVTITIANAEDLEDMKNDLSANYMLVADIDLTDVEWKPVGNTGFPFTGTLDGNGFTISNVTVADGEFAGLFGCIDDATIKNLTLDNVNVTGSSYLGSLAGRAKNGFLVENVQVTGVVEVTGTNEYIGGLFGYAYEGSIKQTLVNSTLIGNNSVGGLTGYAGFVEFEGCNTNCTISEASAGNVFGGLTGYAYESVIKTSNTNSTITGQENLGGLIGYGNFIQASDCIVNTDVNGSDYIGGVSGTIDRGDLTKIRATGSVSGKDYVGGLIGQSKNKGSIVESYYEGDIKGHDIIGGIIGYSEFCAVNKSYADADMEVSGNFSGGFIGFYKEAWDLVTIKDSFAVGSISSLTERFHTGGFIGYTEGGLKIENCYSAMKAVQGVIDGGFISHGEGLITENNFYDGTASNANPSNRYNISRHSHTMTAQTNYTNWDFIDIWNIDEGSSYPYLKCFVDKPVGVSDVAVSPLDEGDGTAASPYRIRTIEQLDHVRYDLSKVYALYEDLNMLNTDFRAIGSEEQPFTGELDGRDYVLYGLTITSEDDYVGLFSKLEGASIHNLKLNGTNITGNDYVGAIAGSASVNTTVEKVRLIDSNSVAGNDYVGGLIGRTTDSSYNNIYLDVTVTGHKSVGGMIGSARGTTIEYSRVLGAVTGTDDQVGGLSGFLTESSVLNCYMRGTITGNHRVGGLIGLYSYEGDSSITNSYVVPTITAVNLDQAIIGDSYGGAVYSTYQDSDVSGYTSGIGAERTTSQMMSQSTYTGWDFDTVWRIQNAATYPELREIETPENFAVVNVFSRSIELSWSPSEGAIGYEIEVDDDTIVAFDGNTTSHIFTNLIPGTQYTFRVRAVAESQKSDYSDKQIVITLLDTPTLTSNYIEDTSIELSWTAIENTTHYLLEVNGETQTVYGTSLSIADYTLGKSYSLRIQAVNDITKSLWSNQNTHVTHSSTTPYIYTEFVTMPSETDGAFELLVKAVNVNDVYTAELSVLYDAVITQIEEAGIELVDMNVAANPYIFTQRTADGQIDTMASLTGRMAGQDGTVVLMKITGVMVSDALTTISFDDVSLVNSDGDFVTDEATFEQNIWLVKDR